ncbi:MULTISPECIES: SDR family oxidoreductase [Methylobacterium]|uniref:Protein YeeZ n=2 Tax=Pseudomonadota TaxID=1224 RepID=A0ABQ4SYV1_9HYPH|nr:MULTISPECIES: SDR family oxidoreductase [Methylobacterium]PIU05054.1 MAG: NAD(P)-dependent oxidoreductase [Methylobacterium sp. CG09_land_8_20_14_0_10_71_15]PIU11575.1 MAG: NAD(P)-dependent oxidoreductase [Methylobacterium sp. CG08_land_8_20_14_0_20_71_15]GBU16546.1 NAD(P)-dependent oxidoreductase [Methylobacterium sp.]GJE07648.1 Protein YeeZ [Methylobacterium jeotgali]
MNLFVFGLGFSGRAFAERVRGRFGTIRATVTETARAEAIEAETGFAMRAFGPEADDPRIAEDLADSDALLVAAPPGPGGDTVLARYADAVAGSRIAWIGYLSTIGVYGDHGGAWIDETTPATPKSARSKERLAVEEAWLSLGARSGKAVQMFRLSGIYGPGRSPITKLREGRSQRIVKQGQVFNRIHVADIAATLEASLDRPRPGAVYNVTDDEPAPPQTVIEHAARLTGLPLPPEVDFETADLSPMARSFYGENKRVRNRLIREELGVSLAYPTYREGLAILAGEA